MLPASLLSGQAFQLHLNVSYVTHERARSLPQDFSVERDDWHSKTVVLRTRLSSGQHSACEDPTFDKNRSSSLLQKSHQLYCPWSYLVYDGVRLSTDDYLKRNSGLLPEALRPYQQQPHVYCYHPLGCCFVLL